MIDFKERVLAQIEMLNRGKPLEAIDEFFSDDITMYDNDTIFAQGKVESRKKQEPYILSAKEIDGNIEAVKIDMDKEIVIFRNKSKFTNSDESQVQINGLCWQQWKNGVVSTERYYSGELMDKKIKEFYSNKTQLQ